MLMAIVTSPDNHRSLARYKEIARRLALAESLTDDQARTLAAEGKAVVWIDAGLHATEAANAQALTQMVYEMASRDDGETRRILNDVIFLAAFSNPDGLELVANWYMREREPAKRSMGGLPVLYQKYIGHDNNRESLLMNMPESESIGRVLYREWFPQIMFNQHQSGPAGTVLFVGQMRDPSNPFFDPLMAPSMELVSAAIHSRFVAEGKPGATNRSFASYQNWWNGGVRSTACFHNQIGILSEISGSPTPIEIAFVPKNLVATNDNPFPVQPQTWRFRQTIDYLLTANRAILDIASARKEHFLFNIYRMGRNGIDKGNRDTWTFTSKRLAEVQAAMARDNVTAGRGGAPLKYAAALRDPGAARRPRLRPPVGPAGLPDRDHVRQRAHQERGDGAPGDRGLQRRRAKLPGRIVRGQDRAGVPAARARQLRAPGLSRRLRVSRAGRRCARTTSPDTRWPTRWECSSTGSSKGSTARSRRSRGRPSPPAGRVVGAAKPAGYLLSHRPNAAATAVNRLLAKGESVYWLDAPLQVGATSYPAGTIYVPAVASTPAAVAALASDLGLDFVGLAVRACGQRPPAEAAAHRRGGRLRRVHDVRLDAVAAHAVRVPPPGGLSCGARCRQSAREVRRHRLRGRPRARVGARGGRAVAARRSHGPRRVPRSPRRRHRRQDDASTPELPRGRRHDHRHRRIHVDCRRSSACRSRARSSNPAPTSRCRRRSSTRRAASCRSAWTRRNRSPTDCRRRSTSSSTTTRCSGSSRAPPSGRSPGSRRNVRSAAVGPGA